MLNRSKRFCEWKSTYAYFVLLLPVVIIISGCNPNQDTAGQDVKAIRGIAFLIIEANYAEPKNESAIKEGVKYSRRWLSKQTMDKRNKLEELSYMLSALIINLNIEYLEKMTNQTEHVAGKLDEKNKFIFENTINEDEGFAIEWQEHKNELNDKMLKSIGEFRKKIETEQQKEHVISITRELYTQSQPVLRQLMENRIREIFEK